MKKIILLLISLLLLGCSMKNNIDNYRQRILNENNTKNTIIEGLWFVSSGNFMYDVKDFSGNFIDTNYGWILIGSATGYNRSQYARPEYKRTEVSWSIQYKENSDELLWRCSLSRTNFSFKTPFNNSYLEVSKDVSGKPTSVLLKRSRLATQRYPRGIYANSYTTFSVE